MSRRFCPLHQEYFYADQYCRSCEAEKRRTDINRMDDVATLEAAIERGAGPEKGACHHCGGIFAEETRRRWAPGETWSGDMLEHEKSGVCPACHRDARGQGAITAWDSNEWSQYFDSRLQKAEALREVAEVLQEAQKYDHSLDDEEVQRALGPLIEKAVAVLDGAKRVSDMGVVPALITAAG